MYTIRKGDTLSKIATANKTTVKSLVSANPHLKNPNKIRAGAQLALRHSDNFDLPHAGQPDARKLKAGGDTFQAGSGNKSGPTGSSSGNLRSDAARATSEAGVPAAWANNSSLWSLLKRENVTHNPTKKNPTSSAYGIFQFLDSTWKGTGVSKTADQYKQFVAGYRYIKDRYKTPERAWNFWQKHNWY